METVNMMQVSDIQNLTAISDNVSPELLQPFIHNAQQMYIKPILGDALYDDIINVLSTGGTYYDNLLQGYIYYALAYYAFYNYLPFAAFKVTKAGVTKQHGDSSDNVEIDELGLLIKRVESMASHYANSLRDYLNGAGGLIYTLYRQDCAMPDKNQSSTIFLPKRRGEYSNYNPSNGNYI